MFFSWTSFSPRSPPFRVPLFFVATTEVSVAVQLYQSSKSYGVGCHSIPHARESEGRTIFDVRIPTLGISCVVGLAGCRFRRYFACMIQDILKNKRSPMFALTPEFIFNQSKPMETGTIFLRFRYFVYLNILSKAFTRHYPSTVTLVLPPKSGTTLFC